MSNLVKQEYVAMQNATVANNMELMKQQAELLIQTKLAPAALNSVEKVISVALMGKELGIPMNLALYNIYLINGRPSLSVHAIAALLKRANIHFQCTEDFVAIDLATNQPVSGDVAGKQITNRTTFMFKSVWNGEVQTQTYSMTMKEANIAEWTTKDTWKKMPKIMLRNRCLAIGARLVAPDILMGMYEVSEVADVEKITLNYDDEGNLRDYK